MSSPVVRGGGGNAPVALAITIYLGLLVASLVLVTWAALRLGTFLLTRGVRWARSR